MPLPAPRSRRLQGLKAAAAAAGLVLAATLAVQGLQSQTPAPASAAPAASGRAIGATGWTCPDGASPLTSLPGACTHGSDDDFKDAASASAVAGTVAPVHVTCTGTGTDGNRIQFLYGYPQGARNNLAADQRGFQNDIAVANGIYYTSARQTGGTRTLRVTTSGCTPTITPVALPGSAFTTFDATIAALRARGYTAANRKYVLFADAQSLCGIGTVIADDRKTQQNANNTGPSYARVDRVCWNGPTVAHEITHELGGVELSAPHSTGHFHCTDQADLMCYADAPHVTMHTACPASQANLLDCHKDDYFSTAPAKGTYLATHWNVADSSFLVGGGPAAIPTPGYVRAASASWDWTQITFTWQPATGPVTGYAIDRQIGTGPFTRVGALPATARTFTDHSPAHGASMTYRLAAINQGQPGGYLTWSVTLPAQPAVTQTTTTSTTAEITFTVTGPSNQRPIQQLNPDTGAWETPSQLTVSSIGAGTYRALLSNLQPGTAYTFALQNTINYTDGSITSPATRVTLQTSP